MTAWTYFYFIFPMKYLFWVVVLCSFVILWWCNRANTPVVLEQQSTNKTITVPVADEYRTITVDAKRWSYTPSEITVKKWEKVKLKINDVDTTHSAVFWTMQTTQDSDGTIVLDTSVAGIFPFRCAVFCGEWHPKMQWKVIVE